MRSLCCAGGDASVAIADDAKKKKQQSEFRYKAVFGKAKLNRLY